MEIIGGRSGNKKITIISERFSCTAKYLKPKIIVCQIRPVSPLLVFLKKHPYLPIPKTILLILFIVNSLTNKKEAIIGGILGGLLFASLKTSPSKKPVIEELWTMVVTTLPIILLILLYIKDRISTWHGAEHMAIASYIRSNGSYGIEDITRESPINSKCGGRLALPFIFGTIVVNLVSRALSIRQTVPFFLTIEFILWIDTLMGFDRMPIFSYVSYILQKYITTSEPHEAELLTAQKAIQALVEAHENI